MAKQKAAGRPNTKNNKNTIQTPPDNRVNLNIGMIFFMVILIYVLYSVVRFATAKHVVGYEVRTGSISTNNIYEGVALREEQIVNSDYAGHINYYTRQGDRLAAGKLAYTIDETGQISERVSADTAEGSLFNKDNYLELRGDISDYKNQFQPDNFYTVYSFRDSINSTVQKITNNSILTDIESIGDSASIHYCTTPETGYIVYETDGYEDKTFESLTAADFDSTNYQKTTLENNALISVGDPAFRLETAEDWNIAIRLDSEETAQELSDLGVVKVRFLKNQYESWATITTKADEGGNYFACLSFTNSMVSFCGDRFIDLELMTNDTVGLKIPKTALVDDEFFLVPADYIAKGSGGQDTVLREIYDENGDKSTEVVSVTVYREEDGYVYLDKTALRTGDVLDHLESNETVTVSKIGQLTGVYNINEGYADFRQVSVITENNEYAIVAPDSMYGLREYDYIVLDAATMSPNEFLYE